MELKKLSRNYLVRIGVAVVSRDLPRLPFLCAGLRIRDLFSRPEVPDLDLYPPASTFTLHPEENKPQPRWICVSMWPHISPWTVLVAAILAGIGNVAGVHVYTGGNVEARNGTEYRLKCTFQSTHPVGKRTSVTWSFRPENGGTEEVVMYYQEQPYASATGRFKGRVVWSGNIWKKDVSITITDLRFTDNGTFMCSVLNPPDVDLIVGEVRLAVVEKVTYSEMLILGIVIGGATGLVVLIVICMVTVQLCRRRREDLSMEEAEADLRSEERVYESKDGVEMRKFNGEVQSLTEEAESARVS